MLSIFSPIEVEVPHLGDDYDDVEKNNMMVMVVNATHWMIRKGPIDNIIETLDEKGGEIGIWPDGQSAINGHLWLGEPSNLIFGKIWDFGPTEGGRGLPIPNFYPIFPEQYLLW